MSKFPVEMSDNEGIVDSVNYLLSGPGGLGQNFQGFADYRGAYLTGAFREPFTAPLTTTPPPSFYVAPVNISDIQVPINPGRILEITFASAQAVPPFNPGDTVIIADVVDDEAADFFNDTYSRSVVSCSTTGVILQTQRTFTWPNYVSGGNISKNLADIESSTDCNGRVTVYGPTDRVFITSQINVDTSFTCSTTSEFDVIVRINRYRGFPTIVANDNDFLFDLDTNPIVSEQRTHYTKTTSGTTGNVEYIFTTVLDQPSFGYYWYILDYVFSNLDPDRGGLLRQPMGSTATYTYAGTAAAQGSTTDYFNVIPTTLTGSGSGADIDIQLLAGASTAYSEANTTINFINDAGIDYEVGDTIKILGTDLGGATPANDLTLTIQAIDPQPYPGDALPDVVELGLRSFTAQVIKQ
jgi:hypothetical protein